MTLLQPARHQDSKGKPTNIICIELVNANQNANSRSPEGPGPQWTKDGKLALVEIVDEYGIKLDVEN